MRRLWIVVLLVAASVLPASGQIFDQTYLDNKGLSDRFTLNLGSFITTFNTSASASGEEPLPCLTIDWISGQFPAQRDYACKKYHDFIHAGIGERTIWTSVKGLIILGEENFVEQFIDHVKRHEAIREIPRSQRYVNRPKLAELFGSEEIKDKHRRNQLIRDAVIRYGYNQDEVSDHLGMHYSTISRLLKREEKLSKLKTPLVAEAIHRGDGIRLIFGG